MVSPPPFVCKGGAGGWSVLPPRSGPVKRPFPPGRRAGRGLLRSRRRRSRRREGRGGRRGRRGQGPRSRRSRRPRRGRSRRSRRPRRG